MKKDRQNRLISNIDNKARLFRAGGAVALAIAAGVSLPKSTAIAVGLTVTSAFLAFEAVQGWCAFRACGVKTKF
jgi:hypothetical protein